MVFRRVPDDRVVGAEISMGEDVTESCNGAPRDFGEAEDHFLGQVLHGLPDDLKVTGHRINSPAILDE